MLKDVRIQNYRLFEDLQLNDLGRVNLIVGQNNVGKTSLLEALYLLTSKNNPFAFFEIAEHRYGNYIHFLPNNTGGDPKESDVFLDDNFINHLFFEPQKLSSFLSGNNNQNKISLEITANLPELVEYKKDVEVEDIFFTYQIDSEITSHEIIPGGYVTPQNQNWKTLPQNTRYVNPLMPVSSNLNDLWNKITLTPQEDLLIKILKIIEPKIERINFRNHKTIDYDILVKLKNNPHPISLHSFGNGLSYLLKIGLHLVLAKDGVLCIDEIDTGLHYRMMHKMWKVILQTAQELNVQVFATTHSWDCIKAFSEALKEQQNSDLGRLIRLQQYEDGEIEAVNYTPEELSFSIFQEIEVR